MELIDTHCHLNDPAFPYDIAQAEQTAAKAGVVQLIVPGMDLETSRRSIQLAAEFPDVCFAAVGVHPHEALTESFDLDASLEELRALVRHPEEVTTEDSDDQRNSSPAAQNDKQIVAMGEIGMDFHHYGRETATQQREAFIAQIKLAEECNLPVIVHGREAYDDVLDVIKAHPGSRGVLHSFEASYEVAKTALDAGWLVSFTALVTYPKYHWLREVVAKLPIDSFMVETDSPYLPAQAIKDRLKKSETRNSKLATNPKLESQTSKPVVGSRGRNNQPAYMVETAQVIAQVRGESLEALAAATTQTARNFFGILEERGE